MPIVGHSNTNICRGDKPVSKNNTSEIQRTKQLIRETQISRYSKKERKNKYRKTLYILRKKEKTNIGKHYIF